jgi:rhamnosyltransferase
MLDNAPRVAVLLPVTGRAPFVEDQIRSIINQQGTRPEIHLLLNGLKDQSAERLVDIAGASLASVRVVQDPLGLPAAFLDLISAQAFQDAPFVAYSDQDDLWHPEKLKAAVEAIGDRRDPVLWVSGRMEFEEGENRNTRLVVPNPWSMADVAVGCPVPGCCMVMNASLLEQVAELANRRGIVMHDWLTVTLATAQGTLIIDPRPLVHYRLHDGQTLGNRRSITMRLVRLLRAAVGRAPCMESQARVLAEWWAVQGLAVPLAIELLAQGRVRALLRACHSGQLRRRTRLGNFTLPCRLVLGRILRLGYTRSDRPWLMPRSRT